MAVEVREAALTAEEAEAPAIQVSETPNFHHEERHRFGASSPRFRGKENRKHFLQHRRQFGHCVGKARGCYRILEFCCQWKYDGYGNVGGSKGKLRL
ncbi:hypothetical protein TSUD_181220 [Trifolium subterraneum]|uniref:Uncharacterized protein n=1 Tax=Trifolium subterraneum TaxID=3900 RepID=A0A2Z6M1J7_TRISU|nr:hypothetical protein TSUD_181220 [Trifolium subterraneum]